MSNPFAAPSRRNVVTSAAGLTLLGLASAPALAQPPVLIPAPLPSWNEGPNRQAILDFVARVTREGGPDFVPPNERIATFDNDGTLWAENPMYFQGLFAFARAHELASKDPVLAQREPFKSILAGDQAAIAKFGEHEIAALMAATHAGMTTEEFNAIVRRWTETAIHPRFQRRYVELVYQPMLELLAYLRANGFKTFIVSGGGVDFMRVFAESAYGIPPEQVIGSSGKTKFEIRDGRAVLIKQADIGSIDDKEGKPVNIDLHIGRRPTAAFGNSDGDLAMLQYAAGGPGARLMLIVHHDDAEREYAYDRQSHVGRLDKALDEATQRNWVVVSMKRDWRTVFPAR
ncbi:HAD family hydrolase [Phreatobacter stygius]|uniref:Haloacid dehalogenase-like hydrolase n=1 Tax=Phreatobacter stygius TaxID=1940610 RepID=A0A4D7B455_9HYPH|nr:HAD family hydrolase [Phreatobacter stygius]QCI68254.1 haloacid dehalogenase-like hydrolase [Phreatobacter stygius]